MYNSAVQSSVNEAYEKSFYKHADQALKELRQSLFNMGFKPVGADKMLSDAIDAVDAWHNSQTVHFSTLRSIFVSICKRECLSNETPERVSHRIKMEVMGLFPHLIDPDHAAH